jgi:hypothetical protein
MLNVRIRLTLDNLLNVESCFAKVACDLAGTVKEEVNAHSLAPPLIQMNGVVADVESQ